MRPRDTVSRVVFLDYLRSLAVLLVLWDHLAGQYLEWRGRSWRPLVLVDRFIATPLSIIQHFGWLGVSLFFLISGFIISHTGSSETRYEFGIKRLLRIYPPLIFAVGVALVVEHARVWWHVIDSGSRTIPVPHGVADAAWSSTLVNYVMTPQPIVLGVAWTLVIEMSFYFLVFLVRPLLLRRGFASWAILIAVFAALSTLRSFGPHYFLLVVSVSYVPLLVLGQAIWLRWISRIPSWEFVAISLVAWGEFIWGLEKIQPTFLQPGNAYGPSIFAAYAIFVAALLLSDRFRPVRLVKAIADRSYSIYLLHGPVGLLVLDATVTHVPFTLAFLLASAATFASVEVSYRLVERPSQRGARKLVALGRRTKAPALQSSAVRVQG